MFLEGIQNGRSMAGRVRKNVLIAAAVLGVSALQNFALADDVLAEKFADTPYVATADLPALGSVPTFYVNLDPITMATYLRMDREEGRKHFDKSKPSLLDPYITKMQSMPVGSSSRNGFSQTNPYICITVVNATIPAWNDPVVGYPCIMGPAGECYSYLFNQLSGPYGEKHVSANSVLYR
jgi:hypothetical protein